MATYGTVVDADAYFNTRLHVLAWTESTTADKTKALQEATNRVDRLRFSGCKVDDNQDLEFPRYYGDDPDGTETIPEDIEIATYECAFSLLDGVDPDLEYENLATSSQGLSSARTTYADGARPQHFANGIPSAYGWRFLKKYLAQVDRIKISRAS